MKSTSLRTFKIKFLTSNVFIFYKNLLCRLQSSCSRHDVNNGVKCKFETLHCLSFNAQSLRSMKRLEDGSVLSNLRSFQGFVYAENLDIVAVTENMA